MVFVGMLRIMIFYDNKVYAWPIYCLEILIVIVIVKCGGRHGNVSHGLEQ